MKTKIVNGEDTLSVSVMCPEMVNHISKNWWSKTWIRLKVISNSFEQTCWANTECIRGIDAAKSNQTTHGVVAMPTCSIHCYHNYVRACIRSQKISCILELVDSSNHQGQAVWWNWKEKLECKSLVTLNHVFSARNKIIPTAFHRRIWKIKSKPRRWPNFPL